MEIVEPEHSEVMAWLTAKHQEQRTTLEKAENLLKGCPQINEAQALIARLRKSVDYYAALIEAVKNSINYKNSCFPPDDSEEDIEEDEAIEADMQRTPAPRELMRDEFQGKSQEEAIVFILKRNLREMTIEEIAERLYSTNSQDEFNRAKASIAVQLRLGAKGGKWLKVSRGTFIANHVTTIL